MKRHLPLFAGFALALLFSVPALAKNPVVVMQTSHGTIEIELYEDKAPITVKNFLEYAKSGFYEGTIFHRVIPGFMIQGGGFTKDMVQKKTRPPIQNEANNGLKNERGTIAMARTQVKDSATSQFFINVVDNDFLNHGVRDFGYAVFGRVTKGMDVVDKIADVPTGNCGRYPNCPKTPVIIEKVTVKEKAASEKKAAPKEKAPTATK